MCKLRMIIVNAAIIEDMRPCADRFNNYVKNYGEKAFTIIEFLELDKITALDKQWVIRGLSEITQDFWVAYALDSAFRVDYLNVENGSYATTAAYAAADAAAAAYSAAYASAAANAADAANAAAYSAAALEQERENQIDALIYLLTNWEA